MDRTTHEAVTARDEAIATMKRILNIPIVLVYANELAAALDAIPDDVLVRLAIERGALTKDKWRSDDDPVLKLYWMRS